MTAAEAANAVAGTSCEPGVSATKITPMTRKTRPWETLRRTGRTSRPAAAGAMLRVTALRPVAGRASPRHRRPERFVRAGSAREQPVHTPHELVFARSEPESKPCAGAVSRPCLSRMTSAGPIVSPSLARPLQPDSTQRGGASREPARRSQAQPRRPPHAALPVPVPAAAVRPSRCTARPRPSSGSSRRRCASPRLDSAGAGCIVDDADAEGELTTCAARQRRQTPRHARRQRRPVAARPRPCA
jgi:hypothetical protein